MKPNVGLPLGQLRSEPEGPLFEFGARQSLGGEFQMRFIVCFPYSFLPRIEIDRSHVAKMEKRKSVPEYLNVPFGAKKCKMSPREACKGWCGSPFSAFRGIGRCKKIGELSGGRLT